jgi:hypothetical protein
MTCLAVAFHRLRFRKARLESVLGGGHLRIYLGYVLPIIDVRHKRVRKAGSVRPQTRALSAFKARVALAAILVPFSFGDDKLKLLGVS